MKEDSMTGGAPCVFLDRDGTLNVEKGYLCKWEDWEWLPGVVDCCRKLLVKLGCVGRRSLLCARPVSLAVRGGNELS